MIVKGLARIEQLVPFEVEVEAEEYQHWLEGEESTDSLLLEYLKSSPDWWMDLALETPSWLHEVTDYDIARAEIDTARTPEAARDAEAGQ